MAVIFHSSTGFLLVLLFMAAVGFMAPMVRGEACSQTIGLCDPDCKQRCSSKFPGGDGSCTFNTGTPLCTCYYFCGPPPSPPSPPAPNRCTSNMGNCSIKECSQECCNQKCTAKYPGLDAEGTCDKIIGGGAILCTCHYNC